MKNLSEGFEIEDVQLYGYTLRNITAKHHHTGANALRNIIVLTHE